MPTVPSFVFEVTQDCNLDCRHCYNVWKCRADYPRGRLPTRETLTILDRMLDQTGADLVSLSGGEPLLRPDLPEIIDHLSRRQKTINLICNGTLLTDRAIERFSGKVKVFELPLLAPDRSLHDQLSGVPGAFDKTTEAIAGLKLANQLVVTVFVATRLNLPYWKETAELAIALGADGIMFNRFNPGGEGAKNIEQLQAEPAALQQALDSAEALSEQYQFPVSCSIAMPPCLFDTGKYRRLTFGFCAAGTDRAYYTLDPLGNVRPCNHSPTILGNIKDQTFAEMSSGSAISDFMDARPAFCGGCRLETTCQGGCKAAAEACYGSLRAEDPFIRAFKALAQKPR